MKMKMIRVHCFQLWHHGMVLFNLFLFMVWWNIFHQIWKTLRYSSTESSNIFSTNLLREEKSMTSRISKVSVKWHGNLYLPFMIQDRMLFVLTTTCHLGTKSCWNSLLKSIIFQKTKAARKLKNQLLSQVYLLLFLWNCLRRSKILWNISRKITIPKVKKW